MSLDIYLFFFTDYKGITKDSKLINLYSVYPVIMDDETDILMPFINRIYSMARIGMSMTLYTLLSDKTEEQVNSIINQVIIIFIYPKKYFF